MHQFIFPFPRLQLNFKVHLSCTFITDQWMWYNLIYNSYTLKMKTKWNYSNLKYSFGTLVSILTHRMLKHDFIILPYSRIIFLLGGNILIFCVSHIIQNGSITSQEIISNGFLLTIAKVLCSTACLLDPFIYLRRSYPFWSWRGSPIREITLTNRDILGFVALFA